MACRVLLKIVYLLTCRVLGLAVLVFGGDRAKDAELLVLRHENAGCAWTPAGFHGSSRSLTPSAARELLVVVPVRPAAERGTLCTQCFRGAGRSFFVPHLGGHVRNICGAHGLCMHTCGPNSIVPAFAAAMRAVEGTLSSTRAAVGGRIMNVTRTVRQPRGTSARSGGVLEASPWRDYSCLPFLNDLNTTARMLPAMPTCWRWPQPASGRRQEMAGACEGGAVGRPRSAPGPGSGNPALPSAPKELLPRRPWRPTRGRSFSTTPPLHCSP